MAEVNIEAVYREYKPAVTAKVRNDLGPSQAVDDVVSEVFVDFARFVKSGKFRGEAKPQTVLFTITDRRIADFFRSKKRDRENYVRRARELAEKITDKDAVFTGEYEIRALFTKVIEAIDVLIGREKDVFWWHGILEISVSDLAERMGISESLVTQLYAEAKKKVAVAIKAAVKGRPSGLSSKEKIEWLDRFFFAYLRLGENKSCLGDGVKLAAAQAHAAIRDAVMKAGEEGGRNG